MPISQIFKHAKILGHSRRSTLRITVLHAFTALSLACTATQSLAVVDARNFQNTSWRCKSSDGAHNKWVVTASIKRIARNSALEACKRDSTLYRTCTAKESDCMMMSHGMNTTAVWKCVALDRLAKSWQNYGNSKRNDAILAAKASCKASSEVPATCYVNTVTCRQTNPFSPTGKH